MTSERFFVKLTNQTSRNCFCFNMEDEDDYIQLYDLDIDENQVVKIQVIFFS